MLNFHRTSGFKVVIHRLPKMSFTTQQIQVPGVNMSPVLYPNPHVKIKRPGDEVQYEAIQITFPLLEDFSNYIEIYRWIIGLGAPQNRKQFEGIIKEGEVSDISIFALNSEEQVQMEFVFHDAFPVSLSSLPLDVSVMSQEPINITAMFEYTYFSIEGVDIDHIKN